MLLLLNCVVFYILKYEMLVGLVCPDAEALLEQLLADELLGEEDDILDGLRLQESVLTKPASQPRSLQPYKQGCRRIRQPWGKARHPLFRRLNIKNLLKET
jgi:hypothetical protein